MRIRTLELRQGWRVAEGDEARTYRARVASASMVASLCRFLEDEPREQFWCLLLNGKHRVQAIHRVSEGTLTGSLVHPREVFCAAIRDGAAAVIVVHNHPSGDPEPSGEDVAVTRRLIEAGTLLGIPVLDHVVLGEDGRHVSLRERLPFP